MSTHVLLVEDSPVAREKVSGILQELGCEVSTAEDGVEGLQVAKRLAASIDLIVLDIQMPKADGITLLRYIRKIADLETTPIVMLTTQADKDTVSKALGFGANDFLRKDATIAHITERLSVHIESARKRQEESAEKGDWSEVVRELIAGSRHAGAGKGPYVLCHVPPMELQDLEEAHGKRQRDFYLRLVDGVRRLNQRYPSLEAGYRIEPESQEVARLLQADEKIPWVLLLARRHEGMSLARMAGMSKAGQNRALHILCDPIASVPESDRKSVTRMGAELVEQGDFDREGLMHQLERFLLPPAQIMGTVKIRELAGATGTNPPDPKAWTVRHTCVNQEGKVLATADVEPSRLTKGDESMPAALYEALARLGPGSRALIDIPDADSQDILYYHVEVVDVD